MATQQESSRPRHERQPSPIDPPNPNYQRNLPRAPNVTFRVLIIGRANAGKTSLLQRVCDTTDSPEVYKVGPRVGRRLERVCPS
jgi:GTP-binding protein EngB required for normal cell division